jgi:hypothetical protein
MFPYVFKQIKIVFNTKQKLLVYCAFLNIRIINMAKEGKYFSDRSENQNIRITQ